MKDMKAQAAKMRAAKIAKYGSNVSPGAVVGSKPSDMDGDEGSMMPMRASGGAVDGEAAKSRMDRPARASGGQVNGKSKGKGGKTVVNVVIAPHDGEKSAPMPVPMPMAGPPMPPPAPPKPPMMAPPGAPPMAGGPPMMHAKVGRVAARASGGRMTAGAGSGEGRLEKIDKK